MAVLTAVAAVTWQLVWEYYWHRLMHLPALYRRFHKVFVCILCACAYVLIWPRIPPLLPHVAALMSDTPFPAPSLPLLPILFIADGRCTTIIKAPNHSMTCIYIRWKRWATI